MDLLGIYFQLKRYCDRRRIQFTRGSSLQNGRRYAHRGEEKLDAGAKNCRL